MTLESKNVFVIGTGKSGIAATNLLNEIGANTILFDQNKELDVDEILKKIKGQVKIVLGELTKEVKESVDLVVLSPGVPIDLPMVEEFRENNVPIWGEIELAYFLGKGKVIAITGTNGKTTTTSLVGEIMKENISSSFVVGNIGNPYTEVATMTKDDSVIVAEISSFQLETIHTFKPLVSAILNITPDHLNRHHTMENYIDTKLSITKNQTKSEFCVLNYEDEVLRTRANELPATVCFFSSQTVLDDGIYLDSDKNIVLSESGNKTVVCNVKELTLLGTHNYENVMAAVLISLKAGVSLDVIRKVIKNFKAVEHRIEFVVEKNGIKFYNDSKGTNPDAAIKGIQAMETPTYLIGGGYDKNNDFTEWIQAFEGKVKLLVLIGQTAKQIAKTAEECGFHDIKFADSLEEAVNICYENASAGESILLSPACASWGMFKNYEERGNMFKDLARGLK